MQVTNSLPLTAVIQPLDERNAVPKKTDTGQLTPQPGESIRYLAEPSSFLHPEGKVVVGEIYTVIGVVASQIITTTEKAGKSLTTSIENINPI